MTAKKSLKFMLLLFPILLYLVMLYYVFDFKIDDSYITLRYARNLTNGHGPVFNPGERVEGYTNFSLVLVEALLAWLGFANLLYVKLFLAGCGVLTIIITEYFGWLHRQSLFASVVGGILVATSSPFILWTAGGLETTLFTCLITVGLLLEIARFNGRLSKRWAGVVGSVFFLVLLTRPDGILFYISVLFFDFWFSVRQKSFSGFLANLMSFLIPTGCYLVWKISFYGRLLPSAFYAKVPVPDSVTGFLSTLQQGLNKFLAFLVLDFNILIILAILVGVIALHQKRSGFAKWFEPIFILSTVVLYIMYLASLGFQIAMDDAFRFYVPLIPMLTILFISLWERAEINLSKNQLFLMGIVLSTIITVRGIDLWRLWHKDLNFGLYHYCISGEGVARGLDTGHINAGLWLNEVANPDDVIVLFDAGAIPYFSELTTIDTWSLNDWQMIQFHREKRLADSEEAKQILEKMHTYIMDQEPEFIVEDNLGLLSDPEIKKQYERVAPDFIYLDTVPRKSDRNPFSSCQPANSYTINIWQRIN